MAVVALSAADVRCGEEPSLLGEVGRKGRVGEGERARIVCLAGDAGRLGDVLVLVLDRGADEDLREGEMFDEEEDDVAEGKTDERVPSAEEDEEAIFGLGSSPTADTGLVIMETDCFNGSALVACLRFATCLAVTLLSMMLLGETLGLLC